MPADHDRQLALVAAMSRPAFYSHDTAPVIRLEQTHLSYVLLTGPFAYKINKAVQFSFVNYGTLAKRRHFCEEEIRLNRLYAPDLYVDVVPIYETEEGFSLVESGVESPVEYAVRMRQFRDEDLLVHVLERGDLAMEDVDFIARQVARFHREGETSPDIAGYGSPDKFRAMVEDNYETLAPFTGKLWSRSDIDAMRSFTDKMLHDFDALLVQRVNEGRVRECHGDLHLGNMCYFQGRIEFFDRIVFNDAFKNIDVFYDLAFLYMDLEFRGFPDLANELLNVYLEETNDFEGVALLRFYACCRSLIRSKVTALESAEEEFPDDLRPLAEDEAREHFALAMRYAAPTPPRAVTLMCGPSGSGKSTVARALAVRTGTIRIRSDAVRKHLAGQSPSARGTDIYTPEMTRETYGFLVREGTRLARLGHPVILDATFEAREQRALALDRVQESGLAARIVRCESDESTLRDRLNARAGDISDADVAVMERQLSSFEELNEAERAFAVDLDTNQPVDYESLFSALEAL